MNKKIYMTSVAIIALTAVVLGSHMPVLTKTQDLSETSPVDTKHAFAMTQKQASRMHSFVPQVSLNEADFSIIDQDPYFLSGQKRKIAAAIALSGLLASFVGLFGVSRSLALFTSFFKSAGKMAGTAAITAAKIPVKAAKLAVKASGQFLVGPGKWVLLLGSLSVFALTGIAHFDLQWQAGALLGAGVTAATVYGFDKARILTQKLGSPFERFARKASPQAAI